MSKSEIGKLLFFSFSIFLFMLPITIAAISVDIPFITPITANPGNSITVEGNVTESAGTGSIFNSNVTCIGSGGVEGTDSWDSFTKQNNSVNWTIMNSTSIEVNITIFLNSSSINGTWTCKVYGNNTSGASAVGSSSDLTVNTRVGVILSQSSCVFTSGQPESGNNAWSCPEGGNNFTILTHDGNIKTNITINGTDLIGQTDSNFLIGVDNVTYKNVSGGSSPPSPPGTLLKKIATILIAFWERGIYPTKSANDLYAWVNYPKPLKVQTYQGTISIIAQQA